MRRATRGVVGSPDGGREAFVCHWRRKRPGFALKPKRERSMTTGTVKWFNPTKGYGFIAPDDGGNDVFLHISAVERAGLSSPNEGDKLNFELERDNKSGKMSAGKLSKA
jgi:CspA family cold shock protein